MSTAYGHAIARMGGLNTAKAFGHVYTEAQRGALGYGTDPERMVWRPGCQGRGCDGRPEFVTRYLYVTGRAGRVTDRIQYACREHGERFAKQHGLLVPA